MGTPIANRNRSETEGLIGFFVNTLVLRTDLSDNPSFCDLLARVREVSISAYTHQDLPFEMLVEALQPQRDLSHTPLFQVMFMLQNAPMSAMELTGLTVSPLPVESTSAKFDITLSMQNTTTGLVGVWEYNTDLFDESTISRMTLHFVTLLEAIVANPHQRIAQLPLLTESEQQQLLVEWNETQADYPFDKCIHELFESQVQRTPDAVAVVYKNQLLTYQQLNSRANQLAHYLQSLGLVTGDVPLTPIQHWFFEQKLPQPHHYNQSFLLSVPSNFQPELLEQVWQELLRHHDALRLRFTHSDSGWQQMYSLPNQRIAFSQIDLSKVRETQLECAIATTATSLQASLNLEENLVLVAFFRLGVDKGARIVLIIHHLVVDGVSWRILLEDLHTAYQQLIQGQRIQLPAKTTSFKDWALHLREYAQTQVLESELAYWLSASGAAVAPMPVDYRVGANSFETAKTLTVWLNEVETQALLQEVPKAYKTQINDVLLTALVLVLSRWTDCKSVLFNLEGHGREDIIDDVDLSRTVGWFTTIFPVYVQLEVTDLENLGTALKSVKEQLRAIPKKGIGYGLLRYLSQNPEITSQLKTLKPAEISFNYLGQFAQVVDSSSMIQLATESSGQGYSLQGERPYLLDINAIITNQRLQIDWTYSTNVHQHKTIEKIALEFVATLGELITHCLSPDNGGYTPTDFPLIEVTQLELDQVLASLELKSQHSKTNRHNVEDIYPLSPMQQGMLFHSLYAPESGVYFEQVSCTLRGSLDVVAFEQAWQQVVARHSIFRTAFLWEGVNPPVQVVYRQVDVTVETYDWRELSVQEQQQQLQVFLDSERQKALPLSQAPLMRLHLIQLDEKIYEFVWSHHHLLLDGWSLALVFKDLLDFYQAIAHQKSLPLQPALSYRNYIAWLKQQDAAKSVEFWLQKLQGFSAPTPLTVDKLLPNLENASVSYGEQQIQLTVPVTTKVQSFVRQHQLTVNNLVQATWALLLSRYSSETDVVFGATMSGRPPALAGVASMVGLFINTLPVRVQISHSTELLGLLKDLQTQLVESEQFSYSSLVEIQGLSDVPRGTSLFESIVVFENYPVDSAILQDNGSFSLSNFCARERTNYPLTVVVVPGEQLLVKIGYDASRFNDGTISRMLGHFVTMLSGIVANPIQRIAQLPLLTEVEQQQLLVEWNQTQTDYPQDKCIHQLFESQCLSTPDAVAVVFENEQLTYGQLNSRANQLAHYLRSLGVGVDVLVGICVTRSIEMVVGILGILKAGGAYVPLDTEYPKERLTFIIEDTQISVLLTTQKLADSIPTHQARVVCYNTDSAVIALESQENPTAEVTSDGLAYVIYTSGSTGKPKGVCVTHRAVNRLVINTNYINIEPKDVIAQASNYAFDAATFEIWGALLHGARLVGVSKDLALSPSYFAAFIRSQRISVLFLTTALFNQIAQEVPSAFNSVRHLLFGGEAVDPKWVKEVLNNGAPPRLLHVYGPTENTTFTSWYLVQDVPEDATTIPIGRPISNTQIYLLDPQLQPVGIGVLGEIYIGGDGVARGYLNRPELTQQKFIPNPFDKSKVTSQNSKLYQTGDLARYLPDGNIEYLGRIDNQVKIRGFRIELGEIETVLSQYPLVQASVVIAREDTTGNKRLVAYIVPQPEVTPRISELRQYLKAKLPEYMIPNAIVILESLPLTPNGKVDRRALPVPEVSSELLDQFVAPRTPIEEILALLWVQVLKVERVGIHDNFFTLGGHSLLATQLISRIRSHLLLELPLRSLFATPTVAELARSIQQLQQQDLQLTCPPIQPRESNASLPLSFAQTRLWFLDQFEPNTAFYNIPVALRLVGTLEVSALEQSLAQIIHRHQALRTNLITVEGQPRQVIRPASDWTLTVVDWQHLPRTDLDIATQQFLSRHAQQPFDLATEALVRASLLVLSPTEHILLVCMHHIISDGWSMGVFVEELTALYNADLQGQPSPLVPLPVQYPDFAIWQRQWLQGDVLQSQLAYWQKQLAGAPALLSVPTTRPRKAVQTFNGAHLEFALSPELTAGLTQLSQQQGATLFMTLLGGFSTLLYRYTGQSDILVGTPIANRNRREIEGLIGFFVNTLVLRTDLSENPSFSSLLTRVREVCLSAYAHQDLPFEMLVEALQPQRDLSHTPLFQVMFALQNAPMSGVELTGLTLSPLPVETHTAKFDLTLSMQNTATGLVGVWEYNTDLFDQSTISRMTVHFVTMLGAIVANPLKQIAQLPLLTEVEQQQLLVEWNQTQADYPQDQCIHQLFESQVQLTPDAVAVVYENQLLTYQQLNTRANQLAHYLRSLGVVADVLVGICVTRSIEMVVGILGILKAGGAYVPLDPEYPTERSTFMLEDARVSVLLTQEKLVDKLPEHKAHLVYLDTDWQKFAQANEIPIACEVKPSNLAYVLYTSGSTGRPKAVAIEHHSPVALVSWAQEVFTLEELAGVLASTSICFDLSVFELFVPLSLGGKVILAKNALHLSTITTANQVTLINTVPSAIAELIRENNLPD